MSCTVQARRYETLLRDHIQIQDLNSRWEYQHSPSLYQSLVAPEKGNKRHHFVRVVPRGPEKLSRMQREIMAEFAQLELVREKNG